MKKWIRNCPTCNKELQYKHEKNMIKANSFAKKCISCSMIGKCIVEKNGFYGKHHTTNTKTILSKLNSGKIIGEEQRLKSSIANKNKIVSAETRLKIKQKAIGRKSSADQRKKQSENYKGDKCFWYGKQLSAEHKLKLRLANISYNNLKYGQIYPNYNKSSISILENKAKELGITDLQHAENGGEFYIKELGYWVDGYSKEKNIVIEYDEPHHYNSNGELREKDKIRQQEIEKLLSCKFIRILS